MNSKTIVDWCESRVGDGYIFGASGQICTEAFRKQQAQQYPQYESTIMDVGKKWDGKRVYDCAQFVRRAFAQVGISLVSGATSQWNKTDWEEKGTIDKMPKGAVCAVYRQSGSTMEHTGVYCGNQYCIHSQGTATGVVKMRLDAYPWTHYAIPKEFGEVKKNMEALYQGVVFDGNLMLRKGNNVSYGKILSIPDGSTITVYEEMNDWLHVGYMKGDTEYTGYCMAKFVKKLDNGNGGNVAEGKVTVTLDKSVAEVLLNALKNAL